MVGGILKRAGKVLKDAKKAKETSTFLKRKKTLGGAKSSITEKYKKEIAHLQSVLDKHRRNKAREATKPSDLKKKKQVKDFVNIRKKTKPVWSKK